MDGKKEKKGTEKFSLIPSNNKQQQQQFQACREIKKNFCSFLFFPP